MGICRVQYGITLACGDLLFPGGVFPDFYVGYVRDLSSPISTTQSGDVSSLSFVAYRGLTKFEGQKYAHKPDWEWVKGAGGNGYFLQRFMAKLTSLSTQDDVEIQRLLQAQDAFIIYRNNNDNFKILGAKNGLSSVAGPVGTDGQAASDEITDTVTLEGAESTKPIRFKVTDVPTTVAYLNARVV